MLKGIAEQGYTVVSTIHQPSAMAFSYFDQLVLLSKGKVCVFVFVCVLEKGRGGGGGGGGVG